MKKISAMICLSAMALSLVACGNSKSTAKEDGTYTAQVSDAAMEESHGWRDTLVVEYKDGKIVNAEFESYDAEGNRKSEAAADVYPMDPSPSAWIPELSENVVKAGESSKVDAVSGATYASENAKALLAAIEKDGVAGETITLE